jgi:hypothetical protein
MLSYYLFKDLLSRGEWQEDGLEAHYMPNGVVLSVNFSEDEDDDRLLTVMYRSPSGVLYRDWRGLGEVKLELVARDVWLKKRLDIHMANDLRHMNGWVSQVMH